jgi:hypothetical protein
MDLVLAFAFSMHLSTLDARNRTGIRYISKDEQRLG